MNHKKQQIHKKKVILTLLLEYKNEGVSMERISRVLDDFNHAVTKSTLTRLQNDKEIEMNEDFLCKITEFGVKTLELLNEYYKPT